MGPARLFPALGNGTGLTKTFTLGPIDWAQSHYQGGDIKVTITAYNSQQVPTTTSVNVALDACKLIR